MRSDLSSAAKQTFQVVAFLATLFVVGIHYQSDSTDHVVSMDVTANQWAQEFLFDGLARVAVPLFAFAAGLFYFRSDDGSFASYREKLTKRCRTVLVPYVIACSVAMAFWLIVRGIEGRAADLTLSNFLTTWLLHPPAEQLWFLRDLMILVLVTPMIRWTTAGTRRRTITLCGLAVLWCLNIQPFPIVADWRLLHIETLAFFVLGRVAWDHTRIIEAIGNASTSLWVATCFVWFGLISTRIILRPDFDVWYVNDFGIADLMIQRASILVGCAALFMTSWRLRFPATLRLSGTSFFVYLAHEFPLRAVAERCSERFLDHSTSCWITLPIVTLTCVGSAILLSEYLPRLFTIATGGRMPAKQVAVQWVSSSGRGEPGSSSPAMTG